MAGFFPHMVILSARRHVILVGKDHCLKYVRILQLQNFSAADGHGVRIYIGKPNDEYYDEQIQNETDRFFYERVTTMYRVMTISILAVVASLILPADAVAQGALGEAPVAIALIEAPFEMPQLKRPVFPDRTFDIRDYGAKGDGTTKNTEAFGKAIAACHAAGGGKVLVPEGQWLTGAIHLKSNVNLYMQEGAEIHFSDDPQDYLPVVFTRWAGYEVVNYSPLIYANGCEKIAVTGPGKLYGHGKKWWEWNKRLNERYKVGPKLQDMAAKGTPPEERVFGSPEVGLRPQFISPINCRNVLLEGFTIAEPGPFWTIQLVYCENVIARELTLLTKGGPNTDGINLDSSRNALIEHCRLDVGDDAVCLKSGINEDGRRVGRPTENVVVRHVTVLGQSHAGIAIGSDTSGGVRNVLAHDCVYDGSVDGILIKSNAMRGGVVENIHYRNITTKNNRTSAIRMITNYGAWGAAPRDATHYPTIRNITFQDITCDGTGRHAIQLIGLPESPIENVRFKNIDLNARNGVSITDAKDVMLRNVTINSQDGVAISLRDCGDVDIQDSVSPPVKTFLHLKGSRTTGIRLQGNDLSKAAKDIVLEKEVPADAVIREESSALQFDLSGRQLYNRPLFGSEPPFVTYGGSLPAFAVSGGWYGGKLGNLHLAIMTQDGNFAAHEAEHVKASYDGLALRYEIRDPRLKEGVLRLQVFPGRATKGCLAHLAAEKLPAGTRVAWVYGGASGQYDFKYPSNYGSKTPVLPLIPEHRQNNSITLTDDGFVLRGAARKGRGAGSIPNVVRSPVSRISVEPAGKVEYVKAGVPDLPVVEIVSLNDKQPVAAVTPETRIYTDREYLFGTQVAEEFVSLKTIQFSNIRAKEGPCPIRFNAEKPVRVFVAFFNHSGGNIAAVPPSWHLYRKDYCVFPDNYADIYWTDYPAGHSTIEFSKGTFVIMGFTSPVASVQGPFPDKAVSSKEATFGRIVVLKDVEKGQSWLRIIEGDSPRSVSIRDDIDHSFREGRRLLDSFKLQTPDTELNLVSQLTILAYRAAWWNNEGTHIALHGATAWCAPYLGWRVLYGATVLGWNDFLGEDFRAHGAHQAGGGAFPSLYFSRSWGYNMDEVFVQQLFHYYNWSGDTELVRDMWPRVEKNLKFRKGKYDPDNDALYTNRLNTWISDYHWYLGGKCTQSSARMYDAFRHMAETAALVGRDPAPFAEEAKKIRDGMARELWLDDQGVYAEYKDTLGLQRHHRAVELPSVYIPIEVGLASPERAARMVAFVRDTFEHIETPGDGLIPYSSPWRPTHPGGFLHSSRSRCPNETLHLALAAYQAGLDEYANRLVRGVRYSVMNSVTAAGSLCNWVDAEGRGSSHPDFADPMSMFFRTVSEGLFGIEPAVPKGKVRFTPRFPREWDDASLSTAGFSVAFNRTGLTETFSFKTDKKLDYEIRLPLRYESIESLKVNGSAIDYVLETEVAMPRICVRIPSCQQADVAVVYRKDATMAKAVAVKTRPLESFLRIPPPHTLADRKACKTVLYDLAPYRNMDLEKVFQQKYTSSEMHSVHWIDVHRDSNSRWDLVKPKPAMETLRSRLDDQGRFVTAESKTQFQIATEPKNVLLLGRWNELPNEVRLPVDTPRVREVCLLVVGRTYPMQSHIANARVILRYKDGGSQETDLINPYNYDDSIGSFADHHSSKNEMVELDGEVHLDRDFISLQKDYTHVNSFKHKQASHADVISLPVDPDKELIAVDVQCLSDQIVFGVMAMTLYQDQ